MHEEASLTIGSLPSPDQAQSFSNVWRAIHAWPSRWPLEDQGTPQQLPPTSGGIQTGMPARSETATVASARLGPGFAFFDAPMMRFVHEGK